MRMAGLGAATGAGTGGGGAETGGGNGIATGIPADGGTGVATGIPAGVTAETPSCWRIIWFTISELSRPQLGQMNCTGFTAISGVMSKAIFVPQAHWIFMGVFFYLLGFRNVTFVGHETAKGAFVPDDSVRPSVNRKLPPNL